MTLSIGLIGCGYIAKKHLETISQLDEVELIAVSDIDGNKMDEAILLYNQLTGINRIIKKFNNFYDLLEDKNIDIVVIATVSGLHAKIASESLVHHKHVILEKPFALSVADGERLIELAKAENRRILVCHQLRYRPVFRKLKALLEKDALGRIHLGVASMRIHRSESYFNNSNWKGTWKHDGGMLLNQGMHLIDLLIWFMGDATTVYGDISNNMDIKDTEDIAAGVLTFHNRAKGIIDANTITKPDNLGYYISLFGENGTFSIGGPSFNKLERCYFPNSSHTNEILSLMEDHNEHKYMYQNFINVLNQKETILLMDEKDAFRSIMTVFAIYEASKCNKVVHLPLESFSTEEMNMERVKEWEKK
ncbi:Gfo/Idh/MocA family protein [Ornithinibacillus bavariensis]|uniref:Gfo/Idh/MocA family protein n=1 Tax=Ornithinibacillus bavariensis TaxID=545502 RepID=UPI000EBF1DDA|nr:gfo/Idh/MocA family oxidoreductase [Ornithinibacillus sp.]